MSYSFSVPPGPVDEFVQRATTALEAAQPPESQIDAAKNAVGLAAELAKHFSVAEGSHVGGSVSGHAYTGEANSARSYMSISLSEVVVQAASD